MKHILAFDSRMIQSPSINSTGVTPVTVLIVDDDELVRELGAELLCGAGFRVLEAGNGEEALSLLERDPNVRVLFTDINMPGPLDGIALASIAAVQWPHLSIIIGSGNALPLSAGLPRGITFIRKPCDSERLIRIIREGTMTPA
jgi:two-component system, response regulator PdtaR